MLATELVQRLDELVAREGDGEVQMKQEAGWSGVGGVAKDDHDGCILLEH